MTEHACEHFSGEQGCLFMCLGLGWWGVNVCISLCAVVWAVFLGVFCMYLCDHEQTLLPALPSSLPTLQGLLQWVGGQPGQGTGVRDCSGPREVVQIDQFLKETAAREASAKLRLQQFIEELLERADRAERQLQVISSSCGSTPSASLGRGGGGAGAGPSTRAPGRTVSAHLPSLLCLHI